MGPRWDLAGNKLPLKRRIKPTYFVLPDPSKATLGARLRFMRRKTGLTINQLAHKARLGHNVIASLERGKTRTLKPWVLGRILPFLAPGFKEAFAEARGDLYDFLAPPDTFGGWLRNLRLRRGMKQKELARALGVSRESIRRYEGDLSRPAKAVSKRLEEVFGPRRCMKDDCP